MSWIQKTRDIKALYAITALIMILIAASAGVAYAEDDVVEFTVKQIFTSTSSAANNTFTYLLKPLGTNNPLPAGSTAQGYTFSISGNNSVKISLPREGAAEVYRYELQLVIETKQPGYTYDQQIYTIEMHLSAGKIFVFNMESKKVEEIVFRNGYDATPSEPMLMTDPPVVKSVFGRPSRNSVFTFRLEAQDASYPMPAGSVGRVKTITIVGSGQSEFGVWSYDKAGVYYYTVYEVNSGESGYTYDTAVYTITDTVRQENGQLKLTRVVTNAANKQVTTLSFINSYNAGGTEKPDKPGGGGGGGGIIRDPDYNIGDGDTPTGTATAEDEPPVDIGDERVPGDGPKTGDEANTALYLALLTLGGLLAIGATTYLTVGKKQKKAGSSI